MLEPSFLRHSGWVGPEQLNRCLHIIGVGATGSNIALLAAKMGWTKFEIWDNDQVEDHNLPNQAYNPEHLGMNKVEALKDVLLKFNPRIEVKTNQKFFNKKDIIDTDGPVVLTTDSMSSRKEIMASCLMNPCVEHVFETRLGFKHGEIAIVDNLDADHVQKWVSTLRRDDEIEEGPCNTRICSTLVNLVASMVVHQLCEKYSSAVWTPKSRTLIQMDPDVLVASFN